MQRVDSGFIEVSAVVAIGLNGDPVVLEATLENRLFLTEAKYQSAAVLLWPNELPQKPGLYEFSGFTVWEEFDEKPSTPQVVHRGTFTLISGYNNTPAEEASVDGRSGTRC